MSLAPSTGANGVLNIDAIPHAPVCADVLAPRAHLAQLGAQGLDMGVHRAVSALAVVAPGSGQQRVAAAVAAGIAGWPLPFPLPARRSSAFPRAANSRGLKGLVR